MENFGKDRKSKKGKGKGKDFKQEEEAYEDTKQNGVASGGYLIGRHPECGKFPADTPLGIKLTLKQISLSMIPLSRTDIASYLRRTRVETQLPW